MLNTLFGMYVTDRFGAKSDRIMWLESVDANSTSDLTLTNAINGATLKNELVTYDYIATKLTTWTTNGIIQIELEPDVESINKIKTYSLTQKTESPLIPPKLIQADISLKLTNQTALPDDVTVILDILKLPQGNTPLLTDIIETMSLAPDNIDIQTLAIQKYTIQTNKLLVYTTKLLEALITANNGIIPPMPPDLPPIISNINTTLIPQLRQVKEQVCKRI